MVNSQPALTNVKKIRKIQLTLVGILVMALYLLYKLPTAPGDTYEPQHIANLYLPNFGIDSEFSTSPESGATLISYLSLRGVLMIVAADKDPMLLFGMMYVVEFLSRFFCYLILFGLIDRLRFVRFPLAMLSSAALSFMGIPIFLLALVLWAIMKHSKASCDCRHHQSAFVVMIVCCTTNALYWHSFSITAMVVISAFILSLGFLGRASKDEKLRHLANLFFICISITIATWIFIRETTVLRSSMFGLLESGRLLNWDEFIQGLFNRGAFIPTEYEFQYEYPIQEDWFNGLRYVSYIFAYSYVIAILFFRTRDERDFEIRISEALLATLLLSDIITKILHFLVVGTIGQDIWLTFLFPLISYHMFISIDKVKVRKAKQNFMKRVTIVAAVSVILFSLILSSSFYAIAVHDQSPSRNTCFGDYYGGFQWIIYNSQSPSILTDANTAGYYQIIYVKEELYKKNIVDNSDISYEQYDSIVKGTFMPEKKNTFLVINIDLYEKHLAFNSLQFWNVFEPLSPDIIASRNDMSCLFDDSFIQVLQ